MGLLGKRHYEELCASYKRTLTKTENRDTLRKLCTLGNSISNYEEDKRVAEEIYVALKFANQRNQNNPNNRDFLRRDTLILNAAEAFRREYR